MKKDKKLIGISIFIILLLWQLISCIIDNELIFPSIIDILKKLINIITSKGLLLSISMSIYRCIISTFISLIIGVGFGVFSYKNKYIYNFLYPIVSIIKSLPTMAFIVLALIWFSKSYAPILIGVLISITIFYDVTLNSLINIDVDIISMCKIYKVKYKDIIIKIYLYSIINGLINILSSTILLIFKVIIAGELYSQPQYGIGAAIQFEKMQLNTDSIIAWIILVGVISTIFDKIIDILIKNRGFNRGEDDVI